MVVGVITIIIVVVVGVCVVVNSTWKSFINDLLYHTLHSNTPFVTVLYL